MKKTLIIIAGIAISALAFGAIMNPDFLRKDKDENEDENPIGIIADHVSYNDMYERWASTTSTHMNMVS